MEQVLNIMQQPIEPRYYFYLSNGQVIKSLEELSLLIEIMDDNVFYSHVTSYKNDFARWIFEVFRLEDLAQKIGPVKSKQDMARILKAYMQNIAAESSAVKEAQPRIAEQPMPILKTVSEPPKIEQPRIIESPKAIESPQPVAAKPVSLPAAAAIKEPAPEIRPIQPVIAEKTVEPQVKQETQENPDAFFKEHPVIIRQAIDAKKSFLQNEALNSISFNPEDGLLKNTDNFKDNYSKVYQKLEYLRKNGFDTTFAEIMLMRIPSKIKIYGVTGEEKDGMQVKRYMNEVIEELNNLK